jgi:hypothetical protein
MKIVLLTTAATVGIGFICYGTRKWLRNEEPVAPQPAYAEVATLKELSHLWKDKEIKIQDASCLWREPTAPQAAGLPRPEFKHEEIDRFYADMIEERPSVSGARRTLIIKLLTMLDDEGDCPSVVRAHAQEAERMYQDDSFTMLATIPLYRHTLTVARNFISKADQEALLADIIIMALAHDIGKIPSYHDKMYRSGDHPIIAGLILNSIPEYVSLPNRVDIDRAVTGHHLLRSDNILTDGLKLSDHEARQSELAMLYAEARERRNQVSETGEDVPPPVATASESTSGNKPTPLPNEEQAHPLGNQELREQYVPTKRDVPTWFAADTLLAAVKKRINLVEATPKGERWVAVSTDPGIVFVNPEGLWSAIREVCGIDPHVLAAEGNESEKRNILYTVVGELSRTRNAIVTEYVSDGYYTTQVSVVTGGGKRITSLLIPFRTQAFGETVSSLEELKTPQLKRMVKEILLKQAEVEKCVGR